MYSHPTLNITYDFDIDPAHYQSLAEIQVDAIRQRNAQDPYADYTTDISLTTQSVENFFYSVGEDYEIVIAYAQTNTDIRKPVAYVVASPAYEDDEHFVIDQIYALRETNLNGCRFNLKQHDLGKNVLNALQENLDDVAHTLTAKPLEGSENFYTRNGFKKDGNLMRRTRNS